MPHATQIAFALFTHIGGEQDRHGGREFRVAHGSCDGEQRRESGSVIARAGSEDAGVDLGGFSGSVGGKYSVEMGGEQNARGVCRLRRIRCGREFGERVARIIDMGIGQPELLEALDEPGRAGGLAEGRRGYAKQFELPAAHLLLLQVQPVERTMDGGGGGKPCDAKLGRGVHRGSPVAVCGLSVSGYSTWCRKRPVGGAVGPAADRLRAAITAEIDSGARRCAPHWTKVPTRLRTM